MGNASKRTYTIINTRTQERKFIVAQNFRSAFKLTGWQTDRLHCVMVPYKDKTLRAPRLLTWNPNY